MLIWNGNKRKAPLTPPMEVRKDTKNATRKGIKGFVSIPDTGKNNGHYLPLIKWFSDGKERGKYRGSYPHLFFQRLIFINSVVLTPFFS